MASLLVVVGIGAAVFVSSMLADIKGDRDGVDLQGIEIHDAGRYVFRGLTPIELPSTSLPDDSVLEAGATVRRGQWQAVPLGDDKIKVDGSGLYVLSGLVDAHVHLRKSANDLLVYLTHGITEVWEMGGERHHLKWEGVPPNDLTLGPKIVTARAKLGTWSFASGLKHNVSGGKTNIRDEADIKEFFAQTESMGYPAIKFGSHIRGELYAPIVQKAKAAKIPVIGHIPYHVSLDDFWADPLDLVVHVEEFTKAIRNEFGRYKSFKDNEFRFFFIKRTAEISRRLAEAKIPVVTNSKLMHNIAAMRTDETFAITRPGIEFLNPQLLDAGIEGVIKGGWIGRFNHYFRDPQDPDEVARLKDYWGGLAEANDVLTKALHSAGVKLIAGTDAPTASVVPGVSLLEELEFLVELGIKAEDVLRMATSNAHKLTEMLFRRGRNSSFLVVEGDPRVDIKNLRNIRYIIASGRVLTPESIAAVKKRIVDTYTKERERRLPR